MSVPKPGPGPTTGVPPADLPGPPSVAPEEAAGSVPAPDPASPIEPSQSEPEETPEEAAEEAQRDGPEGRAKGKEAATYRRRLRETEARLAEVEAKWEAVCRGQVEQIATDVHWPNPAAVWLLGLDLADVLDDDGKVDLEKAREAVRKLGKLNGIGDGPRRPAPDPTLGVSGSPGVPRPSGLESALGESRRKTRR